MPNIVKRTAKKTRDRFLVTITESIAQLNAKLDAQASELETLKQSQAAVNNNQQQVLADINQKINNSGTLRLSETELITKIFSGLKIYLDPRDIAVGLHVALDSSWEYLITL